MVVVYFHSVFVSLGFFVLFCFFTQDINCGPLMTSVVIFNRIGTRRDKHLPEISRNINSKETGCLNK